MSIEKTIPSRSAHMIVVGNKKGGSGKSTIAMHIAVALIKSGQSVATIDLDSRQRSFTHKGTSKNSRLSQFVRV
jgi:chromosome partitioning protein